jgi:hypothetical protein
LQVFVPSASASGDFGASLFNVKDVQAIAVLDMRLMNTDRHDGNILVQETVDHATLTTTRRLVPIDHGCCLPDRVQVCGVEWAWLSWPQVKQPIVGSVREAILSVDVEADAEVLRRLGVRPECIRTMKISTRFLQRCVATTMDEKVTLYDIAVLMSRGNDMENPSDLERLIAKCRWQAAFKCVTASAAATAASSDIRGADDGADAPSSLRTSKEKKEKERQGFTKAKANKVNQSRKPANSRLGFEQPRDDMEEFEDVFMRIFEQAIPNLLKSRN